MDSLPDVGQAISPTGSLYGWGGALPGGDLHGGLTGDELVVEVPGPLPGLAVGVGLGELAAEVVVAAGELFLHRDAVEGAGLAGVSVVLVCGPCSS